MKSPFWRLRLLKSFRMVQRMAETLEQVAAPKPVDAALRFHFSFRQHACPLVGRAGHHFFRIRARVLRIDRTFGLLALWEFYGMLDHKGLPNFKITAMICGTVMLCGSFYYFSKFGPAHSYDFEMAVLLFFLLTVFTRQMFDEPAR